MRGLGRALSFIAVALSCACSQPVTPGSDVVEDTSDAANDSNVTVPDASDAAPADTAPMCSAMPTPMAFVPGPRARHPMDDALRINHVQSEATHNSYHLRGRFDVAEWNYEHAPLGDQLRAQGVRGVELDVHWDARCQRFEVYHLGTVDENTTCRVFADCLLAIREFSAANPGHAPIFVHIEPKDADASFDEARIQALERDVLTVFDRAWVITPDEVRGASPTLAAGIADHGWPTLGAARGRVLFYLDNSGAMRAAYTHGLQDLAGRLMFTDSSPSHPFAGVMVLNDPVSQRDAIASALRAGYLVRTRADSDPNTARMNDRVMLNAALASGTQIVSTDFPAPSADTGYFVEIPMGTPSRCSPVTAPAGCTTSAIEDPALLAR